MFCSSCAKELPADAAACPACGAEVAGKAKSGMPTCAIVGIVVAASGLFLVIIIGIIGAIAVPNLLNAIDRGKMKRTLADGDAIVSVLETHLARTGSYPTAESMAELVEVTVEDTVGTLPTRDGWGHEFAIDSGPEGFELVSYGKNGVADEPSVSEGSWDADLVWYGESAGAAGPER